MQDLIIPSDLFRQIQVSPLELMIDLAVYLYDKEKLSMGQAKKLAGLTQIEFQKEMSSRGVCIKYSIKDFEKDFETINALNT